MEDSSGAIAGAVLDASGQIIEGFSEQVRASNVEMTDCLAILRAVNLVRQRNWSLNQMPET